MAMKIVLKMAVVALLVLGAAQAQRRSDKDCQCKIVQECTSGAENNHYLVTPSLPRRTGLKGFSVRVIGSRHGRSPRAQAAFCEDQCLNLLKNFLSTEYDHTVRMKPDDVVLDDMDYIGHHRICQLADVTEDSCTFTLVSRRPGGTPIRRMIGVTGCLVFTHTSGSTITLKFATDPGTTMIPYGAGVDYTTFMGVNMLTTSIVGTP